MGWRLARSLTVLRQEVNDRYPGRPTAADGTIGDTAHSSRTSDHNPNSAGVVCALDLTEWVQGGVEMNDVLAEHLRSSRDPRIKYVISDGRMFSSYGTNTRKAWEWGTYSGSNAHRQHVHISVRGSYDDTSSWGFSSAPAPAGPVVAPTPKDDDVNWHIVREGTKGQSARNVQGLLVAAARNVTVDGDFGPASAKALRDWQNAAGLVADGVCGEKSYRMFLGI